MANAHCLLSRSLTGSRITLEALLDVPMRVSRFGLIEAPSWTRILDLIKRTK